jgi:hypothetical protein
MIPFLVSIIKEIFAALVSLEHQPLDLKNERKRSMIFEVIFGKMI